MPKNCSKSLFSIPKGVQNGFLLAMDTSNLSFEQNLSNFLNLGIDF